MRWKETWVGAACIGMGEIMFPPEPSSGRARGSKPERASSRARRIELEAQAKMVCDRCPLRLECLTFALENPRIAEFGVWGGKTATERRSLLRVVRKSRREA